MLLLISKIFILQKDIYGVNFYGSMICIGMVVITISTFVILLMTGLHNCNIYYDNDVCCDNTVVKYLIEIMLSVISR